MCIIKVYRFNTHRVYPGIKREVKAMHVSSLLWISIFSLSPIITVSAEKQSLLNKWNQTYEQAEKQLQQRGAQLQGKGIRVLRDAKEQVTKKININKVSIEELVRADLPGIKWKRATAIVNFRNQLPDGCFKSIDQLLQINGIGKWRLDRIRDRLAL